MISRSGRRSVIPLTWWTFVTDVTCQAFRRVSSRTGPARRTTTLAARRLVPRRGAYTARSDPQREAQIHPVGPRRAAPLRATTDLDRGAPHTDARRVALTMGERYAVCPSCRNRAPLKGGPPSARCAPRTAASSSRRRIAIIPWAGARPAAPRSGNSANWCRCLHSKVAAVTHSGLGLAIP